MKSQKILLYMDTFVITYKLSLHYLFWGEDSCEALPAHGGICDNLKDSVLSYLVGMGDGTQALRLSSMCLYPLSQLTSFAITFNRTKFSLFLRHSLTMSIRLALKSQLFSCLHLTSARITGTSFCWFNCRYFSVADQ